MKVLVADDDLISGRSLEQTIKEWGYNATAAKNGEEAWQIIKKEEIRLAVLDWMMPRMDGVELCRRIRQEFQEGISKYIYIILLTGRNQQEDVIQGLSAGADDYMIKPANLLELKVRLQNGKRIISLEDNRIKLASYDNLTKLWYRHKILEFLEEELDRSRRVNLPTSAIMVDIDHFKKINDTHGHFIGDTVLCEVASRLKNAIRRYDKIGRYGGDEMLVVLPNCRQNDLSHIGERLCQAICNEKVESESGLLSVSISLGGASSEFSPKSTADKLVQASDKVLLTAKEQGRNRFVIADPKHTIGMISKR